LLFHRAALTCAAFCMAMGIGVAAGWLLDAPLLLAFRGGVEMNLDTALCFLLSGIAVVSARTGGRVAAGLAAGCLLALSNLVLLEAAWASPSLLRTASATSSATMPLQLALCFIGTSVAVLGYLRHARATLAATVSSLVAAWGVMSMLGYSVDLELLYGSGGVNRMAFSSALTLTVLSAGMLCVIVSDTMEHTPGLMPDWIHVPVGVFTGAAGLILWHATVSQLLERRVRAIDAGSDAMLVVAAGAAVLTTAVARLWVVADRRKTRLEEMHRDLQRTNSDLRRAAAEINTLSGLVPICAWCKSIRDDRGYWEQLEHYWASHADVLFTHGICPTCAQQETPRSCPVSAGQ
jgi:hypothetical protein